jgi:hypothetical protein
VTSVIDLRRPGADTRAHWVITRLERPTGFAKVYRHGRTVRVLVGDDGGAAASDVRAGLAAPRAESVIEARFDFDGTVIVETRSAPPALLVGRGGTQLLPATPGLRRPAQMAEGDVLLLCSASALDAPPIGLVEILKAPARQVLGMSPELMLSMVMGDEPDGAAAVVMRAHLA